MKYPAISLILDTTANKVHPDGVFTPEQDNDKTSVEPVHSYDAFHTRSGMSGVKGIIGMHRFNIFVLALSCSCVKTPLHLCICSLTVYINDLLCKTKSMLISTLMS